MHTPTVIQMEAAECGAAALGIVLGYFGKSIPLAELRYQCGVTRDGSNAANLMKAAAHYQLQGNGFKVNADEAEALSLPFIVFWNFNHFLVVEGFSKNWVYLNDPAYGPRKITHEEFEEAFSQIAFTFEPKKEFQREKRTPSLWNQLESRLRGIRLPIVFVALCGFGLLVPGWGMPVTLQVFFDSVLGSVGISWKWGVPLALFILTLIAGSFKWLQESFLNRLNTRLLVKYFGHFIWHILRLPLEFYAQRFGGEIAYRTTLNENVAKALTGNLATTAVNGFLIIFYASAMFYYSPLIALVGIFAAFLNLLILWVVARSRKDAFARMQQEMGKSIGFSIGALQNIETIKSVGNESDFFEKWAGYTTKKMNAEREISLKDVILTSLPLTLQDLSMAALLGIGAWRAIHYEDMTIGMLIALQGFLYAFLLPVMEMVNLGTQVQTLQIDMGRLDDVLKNPVDSSFVESKHPQEPLSSRLEGFLEFKNVSFAYGPLDPPLIENLSFSLKPGESLALVGPTGCGKSTIAKLISGLYLPRSGEILYDGRKKEEYTRTAFALSLSSIDQQIFLFSGTIKENLTLWDELISNEELVESAQKACIHDEILLRLDGYNTQVLEGGINFSGGERQRLEIARALVTKPSILIMDEATSALDSKIEEEILKNIKAAKCTTIMIAHRLSTIRDCNEILVLDLGKVVQRGTHETLKNVEGLYRELVMKESV
ncbi:MAG: NHLP family bacteriocin export ABC transporter peptidase/permease/ATPase subunit [Chlamydiota bacterium]